MTRSPLTTLLALAAYLFPLACLLGSDAAAQGLVQVYLGGVVQAPASEPDTDGDASGDDASVSIGSHGHLVEIEVDALAGQLPAELLLHLHVAHGTTGLDLLQLVASRLERVGIIATLTGAATAEGAGAHATSGSLWIDAATRVHLRLGGGLVGEVSCVEGPPTAIRLIPGSAIGGPATVSVAASTAIVMPGRRPIRGRATFSASVADAENSAEAATALWTAATNRWVSERPGSDTWRPIKMASGATITGVSVRAAGRSDWGLEVSL
ncbi:hypothetical protein Poly30_40370 [Planctomycetes bacterium Poly30]|uniref:Uncharacterized protein n=1 Tax=Saltatorellus ferox TaxID=2528018 RepID=A0A518EWN7_9BACT|nr:hypothetical protein Poly30_40370 [Planctomycetes bacterium Poly30]